MTKKFTAIAMGIVMLIATACKKENESRTFNAAGFWRGNAYLIHAAVLVNPNGTASIYFGIPGLDTAHAVHKGSGPCIINGNSIKAYGVTPANDTLFAETTLESNEQMTGSMYTSYYTQIMDCKLKRQ